MDLKRRKAMGGMVSQGMEPFLLRASCFLGPRSGVICTRKTHTDVEQELPPLDGSVSGLVLM